MAETNQSELERLHVELEQNEEVFHIIHKHWGRILWPFFAGGLLITLSIGALLFVTLSGDFFNFGGGFFFFLLMIWYTAIMLYVISEWYSYRHSAVVLTNQRLIDLQQLNLVTRRTQTTDIYEIQSCSGEVAPGWGTLFHYGFLWINTIGDQPVRVSFVPSPETVSGQVMHFHNLVAHGGADLHDLHPDNESEAQAEAELEEISETLDSIDSQANPLKSTDQPFDATTQPKPVKEATLLTFHIPSEQLHEVTKDLPAQKEPTVRYLEKTDYYEIETIIPSDRIDSAVNSLRQQGAEDITLQNVSLIE